jgi:succinate-semialdehyde dehydrogenase/glutarate-semialdehyde dehydrogenase
LAATRPSSCSTTPISTSRRRRDVSKYRNNGQTCVCANRIYVQTGVYDAFAEKPRRRRWRPMKVGDGLRGRYYPIRPADQRESAVAKVEEHIADATSLRVRRCAPAARGHDQGRHLLPAHRS